MRRETIPFLRENGRRETLYMIGIGGSGMYGLARLALDLGYTVLGEDARESENVGRLRSFGIHVTVGTGSLPLGVDAVVYSLAIDAEHPQRKEAQRRKIAVYTRTQMLEKLMKGYLVRIAVAGSHGKSSTVGMCAHILDVAGLSPTVLVGADLSKKEGGYRKGAGNILLTEACEYRDAFLSFSPTHAVVLNADWEHADYFPSRESVLSSFDRFLNGQSVVLRLAGADTGLSADHTLGSARGFHIRELTVDKGCPHFSVFYGEALLSKISLRVMGAHQAQNALAAFVLTYLLGVPIPSIRSALASYPGVGGRMEYQKDFYGSPLYLDYAHHPAELLAAIRSAKSVRKRVACVFEPHTYSRVSAFEEELLSALSLADSVGILPIYAAREKNVYGVSSRALAKKCGGAYLPSFASAAAFLRENAGEECALLLAGAGLIREVLPLTE